MTTIWITRHEKCAKGNFDLNGVPKVVKKHNNENVKQSAEVDSNDNNEPQLNFKPF